VQAASSIRRWPERSRIWMIELPSLELDPYAPQCLRAPGEYYRALHGEAAGVFLPHYGAIAVGRIELVERIFRDWRRFTSARGVGLADFAKESPWRAPSIVLEVDPPAHERTRNVLARALSPLAVQQRRGVMAAEAQGFVEAALDRRTLDGVTDLAEAYPLKVFGDAVGLDETPRGNLLRYGRMVFNALGPDNALRREAMSAAADVLPWIAARCARGSLSKEGFGATIHAAADTGELTVEEAGLLVRSLLSAGIDTTVATLGFLLERLAHHPAQWQRLRADPGLVPAVIDETLRHASPVHTFCRTSIEDVELPGLVIPAGTKLLCVLAAANRDGSRWGSPDAFDIERSRRPHVAFGSGIHVCVGQHVARLELSCLLEALLARVARLTPTAAPKIEVGNAVNSVASLPLELLPA
jgi:cytochrome P450